MKNKTVQELILRAFIHSYRTSMVRVHTVYDIIYC